ncbi:hypothetical protein [Flavobacterium dankookense]|uniref:Uncharacterized protein n=1 Tax=Flavobacterium dankookense TaxID=706186 RepID=A0A4V3CSC5_9FLAO|nr:hypothetical protein [Flavobacterium dankookense]TDP60092.1 hypothetical protein BC748_1065 [Flavobacterium dankookense]
MEKKFYLCGLRPVIVEIYETYENYLALNMQTGVFEQNFRYSHQVTYDPDGDVEELSEQKFNTYVEKLKKERGL